ncbi:hypothetical protein ACQ4M4_06600 [Leptolyngbya sp. AN02str]|uniref:hypothetical protein n=1 Tax=Leptolyngbya sp. AN02str TaxID=3423363 RepID=UPI003D3183E5
MVIVSFDEIEQYRALLADNAAAQRSLDVISDCEGDLEDAAISLALRVGQEPTESERWLDGFAKRWRVQLCSSALRTLLIDGAFPDALDTLVAETSIPISLAVPMLLYVHKMGLEEFCKPLEEKL